MKNEERNQKRYISERKYDEYDEKYEMGNEKDEKKQPQERLSLAENLTEY